METLLKLTGFAVLLLLLAVKPFYAGGFLVQVNGSYFWPADQAFKDIYGNALVYGGEINISLRKGLHLWAGGSYCSREGKLTLTGEETRLKIMPLYAGLKFQISGSAVSPYLGIGAGYFRYEETNPLGTLKEGDWGFVAQAGVSFRPIRPLILDVHAGYSYCKIKPVELEADLGGLAAGIGLGFEF
jgi:opacity protein-like surface antigen